MTSRRTLPCGRGSVNAHKQAFLGLVQHPVRLILLACIGMASASGAEVRIAVFGLFHPRALEVMQRGSMVRVTGHAAFPGPGFVLRVPGRIERAYRGRLDVFEEGGELVPVVTMGLETAVASIVAAESPPGARVECLKAQAVVARSFLVASPDRHRHAAFCDTTHCQFLRAPPAAGSAYAAATRATVGILLHYEGRVIAALYSADCGGRTRTLEEARMGPAGYPYFAVLCPAATGSISGHRVGMCQQGSAAMARAGATWMEILEHYFPAATWNQSRPCCE